MDLQLDTLTPERRAKLNTGLEKADAYLQALGLHDARRRVEILNEIAHAADKNSDDPGADAMRKLFDRVHYWTTSQSGMPRDEALLAVWMDGAAECDPDAFLKKQRGSANHALVHGPEFSLSKMTARPMDYGVFPAIARDTRKSLEWLPLLRAIVFWTLVYFAIVLGYPRLFPS